jgi:uncharacterized protein (DUF58 family)
MVRTSLSKIQMRFDLWRANHFGMGKTEYALGWRRIYISPTPIGAGFFLSFLIMLFVSINFGLNTGFLFSFLVIGYGLASAIMVNSNLKGIRVSVANMEAESVFAGQQASFRFTAVSPKGSVRHAIACGFKKRFSMAAGAKMIGLVPFKPCDIFLEIPTVKRGWNQFGIVRIESRFPFGLFCVWGYWNPGIRFIVYPAPEMTESTINLKASKNQHGGVVAANSHADDLAGIRSYQPGDSPRHLAWRQIAKNDGMENGTLYTKKFETMHSESFLFDYADMPASLDVEGRLARMTRWVLDAHMNQHEFCIALPGANSGFGSGENHRNYCLRLLALHDGEER